MELLIQPVRVGTNLQIGSIEGIFHVPFLRLLGAIYCMNHHEPH